MMTAKVFRKYFREIYKLLLYLYFLITLKEDSERVNKKKDDEKLLQIFTGNPN